MPCYSIGENFIIFYCPRHEELTLSSSKKNMPVSDKSTSREAYLTHILNYKNFCKSLKSKNDNISDMFSRFSNIICSNILQV